jgi:hypothetical protein
MTMDAGVQQRMDGIFATLGVVVPAVKLAPSPREYCVRRYVMYSE